MKEVGTLKELDVKPGDVVENMKSRVQYTITDSMYVGNVMVKHSTDPYELISRAIPAPKLWRDMTDAEKGALLLARHEGKVIENRGRFNDWMAAVPHWDDNFAYRVRPEPKIETVTLYNGIENSFDWDLWNKHINKTYRITFNTIDGKPDTASIKMESI